MSYIKHRKDTEFCKQLTSKCYIPTNTRSPYRCSAHGWSERMQDRPLLRGPGGVLASLVSCAQCDQGARAPAGHSGGATHMWAPGFGRIMGVRPRWQRGRDSGKQTLAEMFFGSVLIVTQQVKERYFIQLSFRLGGEACLDHIPAWIWDGSSLDFGMSNLVCHTPPGRHRSAGWSLRSLLPRDRVRRTTRRIS